jgi:hypothetical protein
MLSNAKGNKSLMNASVSSLNLAQMLVDGQTINTNMVLNNKNYDSFKVASNFFIRLRKEDVDLNNSRGANINKMTGHADENASYR